MQAGNVKEKAAKETNEEWMGHKHTHTEGGGDTIRHIWIVLQEA